MEHEEAPHSDAPQEATSAVEVITALTAARTPLPLALLALLREMVMELLRELVMELVIPPEAAVPGATLIFTLYFFTDTEVVFHSNMIVYLFQYFKLEVNGFWRKCIWSMLNHARARLFTICRQV